MLRKKAEVLFWRPDGEGPMEKSSPRQAVAGRLSHELEPRGHDGEGLMEKSSTRQAVAGRVSNEEEPRSHDGEGPPGEVKASTSCRRPSKPRIGAERPRR